MPKKKQLNQNILIELIDRSCGTQQRLILPATVAHYAELMVDGVEFPPVELIWNGKDTYFMWDGFQRVAAAERNGYTHIRANVEIGNLRYAQWMSFHANGEHGQPRGSGIISNILEKILADSEWSLKSLTQIARHVGCSREYVRQMKAKMQKTEEPIKTKGEYTGIITSKKDTVFRPGKAKRLARAGKPAMEPEAPLCDGAGNAVPGNLVNRYLSRAVLLDFINQLDKIKNQIENGIADGNLGYALLNANGFYADYRNIRNRLKSAVPYAICSYCKGEGCKSCHNMGFLNYETWKVAPKNV